jgi:hypothetical protein
MTTPQLVELVQVHFPTVGANIIAVKLNTALQKFVRETKLNVKVSKLAMTGKSVVGKTESVPLTITDMASVYTWSFYKDTTVETVTMKPNTSVMYYVSIATLNTLGTGVDVYSVNFEDDGRVMFYDEYGTELSDFDAEAVTLVINFIKVPATLTVASSSTPEIPSEFHEALSYHVISDLYMASRDLPTVDRLQQSKHYANLYKQEESRANTLFNYQYNLFSVRATQTDDFQE